MERLFDYLLAKWSVKVKNDFIKKLDKNLLLIKKHPESFPLSQKVGLRKCVITKQTTLYYKWL
ncbi:MAG: type II toxin-antitoxin system RelE/ParE family toxin [Flavobacteriaceae bacterium]|nr:type II toxin-antitoxin system RelE/ParE family toxin [Flavobacteriaceae bacterium]